jgi:hypothetical protein
LFFCFSFPLFFFSCLPLKGRLATSRFAGRSLVSGSVRLASHQGSRRTMGLGAAACAALAAGALGYGLLAESPKVDYKVCFCFFFFLEKKNNFYSQGFGS